MIIYFIFFAIEVTGMALILWDGVPIFRHLIRFQQIATVADEFTLLIGVVFIQSSYWKCLQYDPPFNVPKRPFEAHIVLFAGRLSFIFASSIFSLVVYRYSDIFELRFLRSMLMMTVLFSIFCFSRHIERIGALMLSGHRAIK